MLEAFYNQLELEFQNEKEQIEKFLKENHPNLLNESSITAIRDFILGMPLIIKVLNTLQLKNMLKAEEKLIYGFLVSYLLEPNDLLPKDKYGFFGYLDDAYLTGIISKNILGGKELSLLESLSFDTDMINHYLALLERTKIFLPPEVKSKLDSTYKDAVNKALLILKQIDIEELEKKLLS